MKIYYEEFGYDYDRYAFGYRVWGIPESDTDIQNLYERGFLPYSVPVVNENSKSNSFAHELHNECRYYLCRSTRVSVKDFVPSSENRRVQRKVQEFLGVCTSQIVRAKEVLQDSQVLEFILEYFHVKHGEEVMTSERLEYILTYSKQVRVHKYYSENVLIGVVITQETEKMIHYWFSAYSQQVPKQAGLGLYLMIATLESARQYGFEYVYLGTGYGASAAYKANFDQIEHFDGKGWVKGVKLFKEILKNP